MREPEQFILKAPTEKNIFVYEALTSFVKAYQYASGIWGASRSGVDAELDWDSLQWQLEQLVARSKV